MRGRPLLAPVLLGIGLIGTLDEVVLHQLLHWHHFYDPTWNTRDPKTSRIGLLPAEAPLLRRTSQSPCQRSAVAGLDWSRRALASARPRGERPWARFELRDREAGDCAEARCRFARLG